MQKYEKIFTRRFWSYDAGAREDVPWENHRALEPSPPIYYDVNVPQLPTIIKKFSRGMNSGSGQNIYLKLQKKEVWT